MKVKDLIKKLKAVPNQNARVDIMFPYEIENDTSQDFCTEHFYVDICHAQNQEEIEYVELYSLIDQQGIKTIDI